MLYKEFILDEDLDSLSSNIKKFFMEYGNYCIIRNCKNYNDSELINFYEKINDKIGINKSIDLSKNTYEFVNKKWADIKYYYESDEKQFWRSSNHQNIHTDNTFISGEYYCNLTELVCIKSAEFSGSTTIISNDKIIDLLKFIDNNKGSSLYDKLLNKEINMAGNASQVIKRKIIDYNERLNKYIISFNYYPATRGHNSEKDNKIIEEFHQFLEEKITISDLMVKIKLNRGDALIFNDELVMHGRDSFIGLRHYKKTGILLEDICLVNYNDLKY